MYGTAVIMSGYSSVAPPVQDGLNTPERHLFYLAMQTFIYQYRKSIGMLSAYAEPFYPPTEENKYTEESKNEENKESERNNEIEKNSDTKRDETGQNDNRLSTKENTPIGEVNEIKEEEWVTVKCNKRTKVIREAKQEQDNKSATNQYTAIKEDKELFDKKDDEKKLPAEVVQDKEDEEKKPVTKTEVLNKRRIYNINEISLEEMVQHINEYKEKDNIAKVIENKMNEKRENSNHRKTSSNLSFGTKEKKNDNIIVDIDSISEEETDDDETTTGDDDNMIDDDNSDDSSTIKESEENDEEENSHRNEERDHKMEQLLYQNDLLLFRLEQAELNEEKLQEEMYLHNNAKKKETSQEIIKIQKQMKDKEEEWKIKVNEYEKKIETVEKALAVKTKQLIDQLRRRK